VRLRRIQPSPANADPNNQMAAGTVDMLIVPVIVE
jgi:hypothetical protein